jgi:hypothetical protein
MTQNNIIDAFSKLAPIFELIGKNEKWTNFALGINEQEFQELDEVIKKQFYLNGWFTEKSVRNSLLAWSELLSEENLISWSKNYKFATEPKKIGIIMAGNIPLVGFHDFLSVLISGNKVVIKLSSDDNTLLPAIIKLLLLFNDSLSSRIEISKGKIGEIDAVIATGSNNSMHYFNQYFGKYPHLFRKNRTSIAIIEGDESKSELENLGADIFTYFGLGCRNVSQIFIPKDYDINLIFEAIIAHSEIVNHHKYANNYDYNKAIHLMNQEQILDNGFVLFKESDQLFSPLAMLFYHRYENSKELETYIENNSENIQVVVGKNYTPFGKAQNPALWDYADGVDTMKWLEEMAY